MDRPKCEQCRPDNWNYPGFFADAERRTRRGQEQRQCPGCGLWRWPHELAKRQTRKQDEPHSEADKGA